MTKQVLFIGGPLAGKTQTIPDSLVEINSNDGQGNDYNYKIVDTVTMTQANYNQIRNNTHHICASLPMCFGVGGDFGLQAIFLALSNGYQRVAKELHAEIPISSAKEDKEMEGSK